MEIRNNKLRIVIAIILIAISYGYFRFITFLPTTISYILYFALILVSLLIAFISKRRDVTIGILYGLTFVLVSLIFIFTFFTEEL